MLDCQHRQYSYSNKLPVGSYFCNQCQHECLFVAQNHRNQDDLSILLCRTSSNGYTKDQHRTVPSQREAYSMFPNLAMSGYKNKPPVLHTLKRRDPIAEENNRDGPAYHSTEHHTQYTQKKQHVDTTNKAVGVHEDTGFTRAKNVEPVTHYPESNHEGHQPTLKSMINPAVPSIMKTSFQPYVHGTGKEKLNDVSTNSNHDTGFTRFIQPTGAHTAAKGKVKVWNIFFFLI